MNFHRSFVSILSCALFLPALANAKPTKAMSLKPTTEQSVAGTSVSEIKLDFTIAEGMHVQANPSEPPLIATNVSLKANKDLEVFTPKYPVGKMLMVKGLSKEVKTYDGDIQVIIPVRLNKKATAKATKLEGEVRYQACNDNLCFPPEKLAFSVPITVTSAPPSAGK
jgi:DsbC/DsbD-like thiol-disulfide interchange protein